MNSLKYVRISIDQIDAIKVLKNDRLNKISGNYVFYETFFVTTAINDDDEIQETIDYVNCHVTLLLIRNRIHFNLLFNRQIQNFNSKCSLLELDF